LIHDDLASRRAFRDRGVGLCDFGEAEAPGIDLWHELAGFCERSCLCENLAVMGAPFSSEQR
jgi:hypothetical protein